MSGIKDKLLKRLGSADMEELQQQVCKLNEMNEALQAKVISMETDLKNSRQENAQLLKKVEKKQQEENAAFRTGQESPSLASLSRRSTDYSLVDRYQEEIVVLKDKLMSMEGELQKTTQNLDESQRQNDVLGRELESLRDIQSKLTSENSSLKQTMRSVSDSSYAELEHLKVDYTALQNDHTRMQTTSSEQISKLRDSLSVAQEENAELKEQIVRLEQNINELRRSSVTMSERISSLKEQNHHLNNENKYLHQSVRDGGLQKETELERLQMQISNLQADNSRLQTTATNEKMKWQTVFNEIQGENKCLQVKLDKVEQDLETTMRKKSLLDEDLNTMRNQNERMTNENRSLKQMVSREEDKRKSETDGLKNELARVQFDLACAQEKLVRMEQELLFSQRECAGLNDDLGILREQNTRLSVENKSLMESVKRGGF